MNVKQLIKKNRQDNNYSNIYPKTWLGAVADEVSGKLLPEILASFNMYYLPFSKDVLNTRLQVPNPLRRRGIFITYIMPDKSTIVESYISDDIDNENWGKDSNWNPLFSYYNGYFTIPYSNSFAESVMVINANYRHFGTVVAYQSPDTSKLITKRYNSNDFSDIEWKKESNWINISDTNIFSIIEQLNQQQIQIDFLLEKVDYLMKNVCWCPNTEASLIVTPTQLKFTSLDTKAKEVKIEVSPDNLRYDIKVEEV